MKPIRILHVIGGLNAGGAETAVVNWLRLIDRKKYVFDFVVHTDDDFYAPLVRKYGSKIYRLPNPEIHGVISWKREFEKLLRTEKYQIIHSHLFFFNGIICRSAFRMGVNVRISHSHNERSRTRFNLFRLVYGCYSKALIRKYANVYIGCSRRANLALHSVGSDERNGSFILHYGVAPNLFDIKKTKYLQNKFKIKPEKKIFLHIGRFVPAKNHQFLIRIFEQIIKLAPESILVLIGDGELKPKIENMVKSKGLQESVYFIGLSKKIPHWLAVADLFILPSIHEGLPVTLIESQATGLPALISNNISKEISAGIGLIHFADLKREPKFWARLALKKLKHNELDFSARLSGLKRKGFVIEEIVKKLTEIYERSVKKKD